MAIMTDYFPGDSYATPDRVQRALREYLLLGSRWSPYSFFISTIFKYRPLASDGRYDDAIWARSSHEIVEHLESCGAKFRLAGLARLRAGEGPVRPVTFGGTETRSKGRIWGPIMRSRDPIVVTRKDPRADLEKVLREGAEKLARGISIIIFPQGTRAARFLRADFNSLGVKLASKAGVPVVPVAVKTDYWGNSPILRGFGPVRRDRPVHIEFGEPIPVEGRGKAEHERCLDFIESRLREWGADLGDQAK